MTSVQLLNLHDRLTALIGETGALTDELYEADEDRIGDKVAEALRALYRADRRLQRRVGSEITYEWDGQRVILAVQDEPDDFIIGSLEEFEGIFGPEAAPTFTLQSDREALSEAMCPCGCGLTLREVQEQEDALFGDDDDEHPEDFMWSDWD